eukprot:UN25807
MFLKRYLKLEMFQRYKGTWFVMLITTVFWLYIFVGIYNASVEDHQKLDDWLGFDEHLFGQIAAVICWVGDSITWFQCLDSMLQDEAMYSEWAVGCRKWWNNGNNRVYAFWVTFVVGTTTVAATVFNDHGGSGSIWEDWSTWLSTSEFWTSLSRRSYFCFGPADSCSRLGISEF